MNNGNSFKGQIFNRRPATSGWPVRNILGTNRRRCALIMPGLAGSKTTCHRSLFIGQPTGAQGQSSNPPGRQMRIPKFRKVSVASCAAHLVGLVDQVGQGERHGERHGERQDEVDATIDSMKSLMDMIEDSVFRQGPDDLSFNPKCSDEEIIEVMRLIGRSPLKHEESRFPVKRCEESRCLVMRCAAGPAAKRCEEEQMVWLGK